jgi:hypothetical protein
LLPDSTHRDGAVRLDRAAEIALDELAAEMQRAWIDRLGDALRHRRLM